MAFKTPIVLIGTMSAFIFGTSNNRMFITMIEWKKIRKGKKPGPLTPVYQPVNRRYQFSIKSYVVHTTQKAIKFRKICNLINKNFQRSQIPETKLNLADESIKNIFKEAEIFVMDEKTLPIYTHLSNFYKDRIINDINSNNSKDLSYTQFLHRYAKRIVTENGDMWEVMNASELNSSKLRVLRFAKYVSINYLEVEGIRYSQNNPLITNLILSRMGDEMLNR